jgi:hypothetical protein
VRLGMPDSSDDKNMPKVRVNVKRKFLPHVLLQRSAQHHLATSDKNQGGCYYEWFAAIVSSALCVEAIGNSYGKVLIPKWKEVIADLIKKREGASPIKKLQLVAGRCGITPDFESDPWSTARKLTRFRDLICHAKREPFEFEEYRGLHNYGEAMGTKLEADVEKMITKDFAKQSCDAVDKIISMFNKTLKSSELYELAMDGHEFSAAVLND